MRSPLLLIGVVALCGLLGSMLLPCPGLAREPYYVGSVAETEGERALELSEWVRMNGKKAAYVSAKEYYSYRIEGILFVTFLNEKGLWVNEIDFLMEPVPMPKEIEAVLKTKIGERTVRDVFIVQEDLLKGVPMGKNTGSGDGDRTSVNAVRATIFHDLIVLCGVPQISGKCFLVSTVGPGN